MSFTWAYPAGRLPILAPITWTADGWPNLTTVDGGWGSSYNYPLPKHRTPSWVGTDRLHGYELGPQWEWNHNPDPTKYKVKNGLTLWAASVTNSIFTARNTLTRREYGPHSTAIIELDFADMADGDISGLTALRLETSWIGVFRNGTDYYLQTLFGTSLSLSSFQIIEDYGNITDSVQIHKSLIWLRGTLDANPTGSKQGHFSYSFDGEHYVPFGGNFTMMTQWNFFMGERWGIFNYATKQLGGSVKVSSFTLE